MWCRYALLIVALTTGAEERTYFKSEVAGSELPFSDAILSGDTLYISGKGGMIPGTRQVPEDPAEEVRLLMGDFKRTLARADMTMDDLVAVTVYCPDLRLYDVFNEVYRSYFKDRFPTRAFVGSGPLLFGMRFEMQGIAVRRSPSSETRQQPPTL
ncbi:MAG: RidA family protein [Pseudomonadota bacterium]